MTLFGLGHMTGNTEINVSIADDSPRSVVFHCTSINVKSWLFVYGLPVADSNEGADLS